MLAKYIDYKIFELVRDNLVTTLNRYRKQEDASTVYENIFLAPEAIKSKRSFQLSGVKYPYVCLWSDSLPQTNDKMYGKSVIFRDIVAPAEIPTDPNINRRGRLVDFDVKFTIFAGSYFKTFISEIAQDMEEMNLIRYFDIPMTEILPTYNSRIEFRRTSLAYRHQTDERASERKFELMAQMNLSITVPLLDKELLLDAVQIFLNDRKIYEFPTP